MKTDGAGRFELRTIRPGSYPRMRVPAHIHFVLWGGGYPLQWTEQLEFEGDRYLTPDALAKDVLRGDFNTIERLNRAEHDVLNCSLKIKLQPETTYH
jgi:protocatechuate 3,4-dioxygenase beta subunit